MGQSFCLGAVGLLAPAQPTPAFAMGMPASATLAVATDAAVDGGARHTAARRARRADRHHDTSRLPFHVRFRGYRSQGFRPGHARGFTLIELLVTLTILGILAAAAMPNFSSFLHNSRMSTESSKLFTDIETARSEAARRNASVTICPAADGTNCSEDWTQRRVIFVDTDNDGVIGASDEIIRNSDAPNGKTTIVASNLGTTPNLVRFRSFGTSTAPTAAWQFCETGSTLGGRSVALTGSGRPNTQQTPCS